MMTSNVNNNSQRNNSQRKVLMVQNIQNDQSWACFFAFELQNAKKRSNEESSLFTETFLLVTKLITQKPTSHPPREEGGENVNCLSYLHFTYHIPIIELIKSTDMVFVLSCLSTKYERTNTPSPNS